MLKGGYSMAGVLTALVDGPLLLVAVAKTPDGKIMLAEHYFADSEVQAIVVGREMPGSIVKPVHNGGPLILGH